VDPRFDQGGKEKYFLPVSGIRPNFLQCGNPLWYTGKEKDRGSQTLYFAVMQYTHIQGVPGGMCQTSGECSLC